MNYGHENCCTLLIMTIMKVIQGVVLKAWSASTEVMICSNASRGLL